MKDFDTSITLSKLEAAKRQLETAATLWFEEKDSVSIHTLVAAAHRIVHDIAVHQGSSAILLDDVRLANWGYSPKDYKKRLRCAETFFKHAERDYDATYTFSARETEYIFFSAIECFHSLVTEKSHLLTLFIGWFMFRYPELLSNAYRNAFAGMIPKLNKLSRNEFYKEFRNYNFIKMFYRHHKL